MAMERENSNKELVKMVGDKEADEYKKVMVCRVGSDEKYENGGRGSQEDKTSSPRASDLLNSLLLLSLDKIISYTDWGQPGLK